MEGTQTMFGLTMVILSAFFLALAEIFDTLMVNGDMYQGSSKTPWFVSSVIGAILGLIATALAWIIVGQTSELFDLFLLVSSESLITYIPFTIIIAGIFASLCMRCYFSCFASGTTSTLVGMAIATTPLFVFGASSIFDNSILAIQNFVSLFVAVAGLVYFEYVSNDSHSKTRLLSLLGVILFGAAYVVILDLSLPFVEQTYSVDSLTASLVSLPFYWIGFGIAILISHDQEVREFRKNFLTKKKYFLTLVSLEVVGMSFYFFEVFGVAELDVTFLSIVIGAHVIVVWIFDLYMRNKVKKVIKAEKEIFAVSYFTGLSIDDFSHYATPRKKVVMQFIAICLVLIGLIVWPNIH